MDLKYVFCLLIVLLYLFIDGAEFGDLRREHIQFYKIRDSVVNSVSYLLNILYNKNFLYFRVK